MTEKRKPRNGRSVRLRGTVYEREVAAYLNNALYGGEPVVKRALLSGGGRWEGGADLEGLAGFFPELKRTERLALHTAMQQAEDNAAKLKSSDTPIVITRRDGQSTGDSFVVMRLKDFVELVRVSQGLQA